MKKIILWIFAVLLLIFVSSPVQAQMTFDGSGNVGIGTDAPGSKLDVAGTANMTTLSIGSIPVTATATEINHVDGVTSPIQTQLDSKASSSSPTFTGNVGIGTTTPTEKLMLDGGNFLQTAARPVHMGSIEDDTATALKGASAICVSGKYAYVAAGISDGWSGVTADDGVEILDISDPANPVHVGAIFESDDPDTTALSGVRDIQVVGGYAYVASFEDDGLEILDISNPLQPTHVGCIVDDSATRLEGARSLCISGQFAYVVSYSEGGVTVLDISNPASPVHAGSIVSSSLSKLTAIQVRGRYAYVVSDNNKIVVLDVSDPTSITIIGSTQFSVTASEKYAIKDICVSGKYAYVCFDYYNGVQDYHLGTAVVDISDPVHPTINDGRIQLSYTWLAYYSIFVAGKYAYVAGDSDVLVCDISDPSKCVYSSHIHNNSETLLHGANSIAISGKYAYVASFMDGVEVLDISGIDVPAAHIGSIATNCLDVSEDVKIGNNLCVNGGLNVGPGGLKSDGPVSIRDILTLVPRASAPTSPLEGSIYYNKTDHKLYLHNGSGWKEL